MKYGRMAFAVDVLWVAAVSGLSGLGLYHALVSLAPFWFAVLAGIMLASLVSTELAEYAEMKREKKAAE